MLADPEHRSDYAARGPRQAALWPREDDTIADVRAAYASVIVNARAGRE